ncbi:ADP-ribosylglycohydrolase family protein [Microbacterium lushaniae]|nr:ADP-ribosylglycohydrolase family protein [Microbacterium lushaniae]KAA9149403.1 ADP-ribosylglycohydrolase family protein [Microbacterium lushaniae]
MRSRSPASANRPLPVLRRDGIRGFPTLRARSGRPDYTSRRWAGRARRGAELAVSPPAVEGPGHGEGLHPRRPRPRGGERCRNAGDSAVIWTLRDPVEELHTRVLLDGITTRGHPRALVGAICLAGATRHVLSKEGLVETLDLIDAARASLIAGSDAVERLPEDWTLSHQDVETSHYAHLWETTNEEMSRLLDTVEASLRRGSMSMVTETLRELGADGASSGAATINVAAAIYLASRAGARPESGLLQAAFEPGIDPDTVAAMTGALLGATHGSEWLGALRSVQDADYIVKIASELLEHRVQHDELAGV